MVFVAAMAIGIIGGILGAFLAYLIDITGGFFDWGFVVFGLSLAYVSGDALYEFVKAGRR